MADLVATAEPFTLNSGSPNVATLAVGGTLLAQAIVTAIHQTDWQGRLALSNQPRTNLATNSATPPVSLNITASVSGVAPSGYSAYAIVPTIANGQHASGSGVNMDGTSPWSMTVYVAPDGYTQVALEQINAGFALATLNMTTGVITVNGPLAGVTFSAVKLPSGYFAFNITSQVQNGSVPQFFLLVCNNTGATTFAGDGASGILYGGRQVGKAAQLGAYISTGASPVTVLDYTQSAAQITLGQNPATGATLDWDGSGILPGQNWSWPLALPQTPFGNDSPTYKPADNILRTQMQGATKTRPLFTAVPEMITVTLLLSPAQRATLDTFLKSTLKYTLPFDWLDFRTGLTATYAYGGTAMPTEQYLGADAAGTWWRVQFDLELQP